MITTIIIFAFFLILHARMNDAQSNSINGSLNVIVALDSIDDDSSDDQIKKHDLAIKSRITSSENPHWDKSKCNLCHDGSKDITISNNFSHSGEYKNICMSCHEEDITHLYIHPVDLPITNEYKSKIEENWNGDLRLTKNGTMACQTCHDILDQCLPTRSHQKTRNPSFLRGGPFPDRYTLCYRCHDATKYERVNSHDQISDTGYLKLDKCRLCHEVDLTKQIKHGITRDVDQYPLLEDMNADRTQLCVRCHRKIDHPSSAFSIKSSKKYRHLVRLDSSKKRTLDNMHVETGIKLPIEPDTERVYCGTCHQPHQPGVFAGENATGVKMDNHRLRDTPICKYCHEIYRTADDSGYIK
ncbi:MAG: hypothetical protein ABW098_07470 [Candidatus Thiodiazotropha sp.]